MGTHHADGYSANVSGCLVVGERRIRVAKTNEALITLAERCELPPGTEGQLIVTVDGDAFSQMIRLPSGITIAQSTTDYTVAAPF
jgi:hypothetical protein